MCDYFSLGESCLSECQIAPSDKITEMNLQDSEVVAMVEQESPQEETPAEVSEEVPSQEEVVSEEVEESAVTEEPEETLPTPMEESEGETVQDAYLVEEEP